MGAWGRAYYRNVQGGSGRVSRREEKLIKTPDDLRAIDRAKAKRLRKAESRRVNHAKTKHTSQEKRIVKP